MTIGEVTGDGKLRVKDHGVVVAEIPNRELADEAPTLHLYVVDEAADCRHRRWLDPLYGEWIEVVDGAAGPPVR